LTAVEVADDETIVEVPAKLLTHLERDGVSGEVVHTMPPIVHVTESGNYIVRGGRVTDVEALGQMDIAEHESCVEVSRSAMVALVGD
jgi:hypothetical protein